MHGETNKVDQAVEMALLRREVADLKTAHEATDKKIQDLVDAWNASKWLVRAVAVLAGIAASIAVVVGAYTKFTRG